VRGRRKSNDDDPHWMSVQAIVSRDLSARRLQKRTNSNDYISLFVGTGEQIRISIIANDNSHLLNSFCILSVAVIFLHVKSPNTKLAAAHEGNFERKELCYKNALSRQVLPLTLLYL